MFILKQLDYYNGLHHITYNSRSQLNPIWSKGQEFLQPQSRGEMRQKNKTKQKKNSLHDINDAFVTPLHLQSHTKKLYCTLLWLIKFIHDLIGPEHLISQGKWSSKLDYSYFSVKRPSRPKVDSFSFSLWLEEIWQRKCSAPR